MPSVAIHGLGACIEQRGAKGVYTERGNWSLADGTSFRLNPQMVSSERSATKHSLYCSTVMSTRAWLMMTCSLYSSCSISIVASLGDSGGDGGNLIRKPSSSNVPMGVYPIIFSVASASLVYLVTLSRHPCRLLIASWPVLSSM